MQPSEGGKLCQVCNGEGYLKSGYERQPDGRLSDCISRCYNCYGLGWIVEEESGENFLKHKKSGK